MFLKKALEYGNLNYRNDQEIEIYENLGVIHYL